MDTLHVIAALDALAQESRLAIFRMLIEIAPKGLMMGEIGKRMEMPATTLSFHLDKLRQAGLIEKRSDGRRRIFTANYDTLVGTIRYLSENCCKESDQMPCHIVITEKERTS